MEEVPGRTFLVPPCVPLLCTLFNRPIGVETEGLLDYQGQAGIKSIVRWNRSYSQSNLFAHFPSFFSSFCSESRHLSGCAKGAEKAACGETVVQKGVSWSFRFFSAPLGFSSVVMANLITKGAEKKWTLQTTHFLTIVSPHDAFSAPVVHPELKQPNRHFKKKKDRKDQNRHLRDQTGT